MNPPHFPRSLVILMFILVTCTFFVGTLRTFAPAQAAIVFETPTQQVDLPTATSTADFPTPGPTLTPPPASQLPPPTDEEALIPTPPPTYTPTPISYTVYADTTGVIALAILLVVVVLVGLVLGGRSLRMNKK
jgi:hypothetical protein